MTTKPQSLLVGSLSGLELFISTIRLGSVSAAAREHNISQPSATARLRTLERRLGVQLLDRGPGGSSPTSAGEAIAGWAEQVLESVEKMAVGVAAMRTPAEGDHIVRIMASLTVAEYVMPRWLHAHRSSNGRPVDLAVGNSLNVIRAVTRGTVELGFVETPRVTVGLRSAFVGGDRLCIVVAPSHPWARQRRVTPALLQTTPLMMREAGSGTREAFEAAMIAAGCQAAPPVAVMASTTALKAACASGDGISVLSELAVAQDLASGTLVAVPVEGLDLRRQFRALWRQSATSTDAHRFVRRCRSTLQAPF